MMLTNDVNKRLDKGEGMFGLLSIGYACALLKLTLIRWVYQLISQRMYN